ncbi:putative transmembrane protein, partial [Toxoplasma gondii FOU]
MSSSRSPWGSASESDEERSPPSPASRASSPSVSEDAVEDEAHADEAAASSLRAEAAKFLWGDPEGEEAEEDEDDLLDAEDYIQASSSSAAKMTAAQPGLAADGEEGSFDEEVPYAARVLLKDAEARSRKEKLLLAALNSLTHTEVLLANAPADAAGHLSRVCTSQAGEAGAPPPAAPRLSDGGRQGRPSVSLSSRLSWESEQGGEKRRLSSKRPSFSPDATVSSAASAFPPVSAFPSASSQTLERELGRRPPVSAAERPAVARTSSQSSFRASLSTRRPSLSGEEKSTPQVVGAGQLAPKMMKVMREIFGKRKPVGRFGVYGQPSRRDAESPSSACSASPSHARASPSSLPGSSASFPPPTSSSCPVSGVEAQVPRPDSAASVATESSRKQVSVTVTEEAVRQLKDVNLLLKREGCASSLRRQRAQELYDFEDGHMLYQHPRFCAAAIFRENLVARRLAPLWTAVAARYDAVEGSDDAQQIENQQHLLVQLLRCLAFLAGAPPVDWIQYWMKFAPWLDDAKRVDDSRKKEKKRIEELRARRRRLGLHPSEVEKEAEENFFRDEALHQDPPVQEERRLRSHIVMKYYRGMQTTKKALCCPALWQLLSSVFVDKQDFVDRGGRTAEQQRRLDRLVEAREALYTREKEMKRQLLELEEESKKDFDEEDHLPKHRLRRESVGSKKEQEEEMRALKRELESLREEIFEITETLHDLNRSNREELEKAEGLLENLRLLVCAVLLMPPSLPKSVAVTPGTQLSLVVTMLQQRKEKALALSPLHPGGSSLLHLLLRDTHFDLFGRMQKSFSLVELASASNPQEQDFYDVEKMTGGLGRWAVTHVHAELMERIWTVLRTVHGVVSAVPPLAFAELIAEVSDGKGRNRPFTKSAKRLCTLKTQFSHINTYLCVLCLDGYLFLVIWLYIDRRTEKLKFALST